MHPPFSSRCPRPLPSHFSMRNSSNPLHHRSPAMLRHHFSTFFFFLLLLPHLGLALNQEGLLLLKVKAGWEDPDRSLANWNSSNPTPCTWSGVLCSDDPSQSITALDFAGFNLQGPFNPVLCRLQNLTRLSLPFNYLNSTLPGSSLLPCAALSYLDLSNNLLVGPLPDELSVLPGLRHLDLSFNNFSGAIPASFGHFPRLENLSLVDNFLNSTIPAALGKITTLRQLNLSYNSFSPGPIPSQLGNLTSLRQLWLAGCNLVGPIPGSLGDLRNLLNLDLSTNRLTGPIPPSLTRLTRVFQIELYDNLLSGEFPAGVSNLTSLRLIDASSNQLEGPIPAAFFELPVLEGFSLFQNRLTGELPASIARAEKLVNLTLFSNQLTGSIPNDLGKNSPLVFVDLSSNRFTGEIPSNICDQGMLRELLLIDNSLSGSLPESLSRCQTLTRFRLRNNLFSGVVPEGVWGLPNVYLLDLQNNSFSGGISPAISGALHLSKLVISANQFNGSIPEEIGALTNLSEISASDNLLMGLLPASLGKLTGLGKLDLHNHLLSGELLNEIKSWWKLSELNLATNGFTGGIPPELGGLPVLNYLDLSNNHLTGGIPTQLQSLKLNIFNLSNNQLSGKLPPLYANDAYKNSFLGNPGLCGDLAGLCPSSEVPNSRHHQPIWLLVLFFLLSGMVFVVGIGWLYWRYPNFKEARKRLDRSKWTLMSFHKLGFSEYEILDCLDEDNVIGSGASGKVYKVVLSNGEAVAVKKLWGVARKYEQENDDENRIADIGFEAEVATLGKIRHKNIVRLWCSCAHKDCKLLVYEYMPNGSLGDVLHGSKGRLLDWPTRYKIALGAAEGLSYLHHDCVPPIVHRDVKSNNILLDGDFKARVADFGVAKAVDAIGNGPKSMSVIAGSCGYIAPEYAYTLWVNEKSDIYSFGVVILELVTGKLPIDPEFGEKDLVKWVSSTLDQKGIDHVLDPNLDIISHQEEISKVLSIGLQCVSALPINRPSMRRVVKMLLDVCSENSFKAEKNEEKEDGKLSPYYYEETSEFGGYV